MMISEAENTLLQSKPEVIPQEAFDWYDEYAHGLIDRRTFMKRLAQLTAVGFSMNMLSSVLLPNYALAEQVSFNDAEKTGKPGQRAMKTGSESNCF